MSDKKLSKCPLCVLGEMKVYDITKYHSPDICDVYKLMCTNCDTTWDVAVKNGDTVENVWGNIVERWTERRKMSDDDFKDLKLILWAIGDLARVITERSSCDTARNCAKGIIRHLEFVWKIIQKREQNESE